MQPKAILVLYEPNHKLKNSKYFLSFGSNIVGSDPKCQVQINSRAYFSQEYVVNFFLTDDFMYVEALCDDMLQLKSNMSTIKKKDVYKYVEKSCRFVVPIEEIFYIGPYKAIVQVLEVEELKMVRNVANLKNFETPKGDDHSDDEWGAKIKQQQRQCQPQRGMINQLQIPSQHDHTDALSDGTQKLQSQRQADFQPTLQLSDNDRYVYQPTLALDAIQQPSSSKKPPYQNHLQSPQQNLLRSNNHNQNKLDIPQSHQKRSYSQQILYQTIKKQQKMIKQSQQSRKEQNDEEEEMSMPDTIKDESDGAGGDSQGEEMPATISDDDDLNITKHAKSLHEAIDHSKHNNQRMVMTSMKRQQEQPELEDDFLYLFQKESIKKVESNELQMQEKVQKKEIKKKSIFNNYQMSTFRYQKVLPHVNVEQFSSSGVGGGGGNGNVNGNVNANVNGSKKLHTGGLSINSNEEKPQHSIPNNITAKRLSQRNNHNDNSTSPHQPNKRLFKQQEKVMKLANITGWKPKPEDKLQLKKRGYQIVPDSRLDNYDILIVGKECKMATEKLLMAILLQKVIVSEDWVKDKQWTDDKPLPEFTTSVEGISWDVVLRKQRDMTKLFNICGVCYFTNSLESYAKVFSTAGGITTKELNKRKRLNIIIDCESEEDKALYSEMKSCKNWKFYSHRAIAESVLVGEVVFVKYLVDGLSF